jgi:hypothetical protein
MHRRGRKLAPILHFSGIRRNACTQSRRLITRRSQVQILPPLPRKALETGSFACWATFEVAPTPPGGLVVCVVLPGAASDSEPEVHEDYVSAYDLGRFAESARFVPGLPRAQNPVLRDLLPTITTPTQIVAGRDDDLAPWSNNQCLDDLLPNSEIHPLDTGHFAWEQAADEYGRLVVDWVSDGYRRVAAQTSARSPLPGWAAVPLAPESILRSRRQVLTAGAEGLLGLGIERRALAGLAILRASARQGHAVVLEAPLEAFECLLVQLRRLSASAGL